MDNHFLRALLVDDDPDFVQDFILLLPEEMKCDPAVSVDEARSFLRENDVDVIFLDIDLGRGGNGLEFLKELKTDYPYMPVIMITADQKIDSVVKAIHLGASDYIGKSPDLNSLKLSIDRAISENRLRQQRDFFALELDRKFDDLIGESDIMHNIKNEIKRLAQVSSSVLITGPSGTGKELAARCIHRFSERRSHPFVAINCASLSNELIESELFGHEKGAFTGAHSRRIGKFEVVGEGTLFLDEISEIPVEMQAKFLRVLQENEFERVGGNKLIKFRGRVLASSNRDIDAAVKEERIRGDLLYRLDVTRLKLPPLAERREDIPILVKYYIDKKSIEIKKRIIGISDQALEAFGRYDWPGNIRELANCIESAIVRGQGEILELSDFKRLTENHICFPENYEDAKKQFLANFQRQYISGFLKQHNGNISRTAQKMGISRQGLIKMMKSCGLSEN